MLTGQQWSSKIPTRHGTRTSTDRQCNNKGGQAMKLQTSLPPLHFLLQICTNYKNDQTDHVKSGNPLKSGKFSSLFIIPLCFSKEKIIILIGSSLLLPWVWSQKTHTLNDHKLFLRIKIMKNNKNNSN